MCLKNEIRKNFNQYIIKFDVELMCPREVIYLFEELINSKLIFRLEGHLARQAIVYLQAGYFELIPDEQKFLEASNGLTLAKGETVNKLLKRWIKDELNEEESSVFFYRLITEKRMDLIAKNYKVASKCFGQISNGYFSCLANERVIENFEREGNWYETKSKRNK